MGGLALRKCAAMRTAARIEPAKEGFLDAKNGACAGREPGGRSLKGSWANQARSIQGHETGQRKHREKTLCVLRCVRRVRGDSAVLIVRGAARCIHTRARHGAIHCHSAHCHTAAALRMPSHTRAGQTGPCGRCDPQEDRRQHQPRAFSAPSHDSRLRIPSIVSITAVS